MTVTAAAIEKRPRVSGIYRMLNRITGDSYIGRAKDLIKRRQTHFGTLELGTHQNPLLQDACRKYGISAFVFEVLEITEGEACWEDEVSWINSLRPTYNIEVPWRIRRPSPFKGKERPDIKAMWVRIRAQRARWAKRK